MQEASVDLDLLRRFEHHLDPRNPEGGVVPARVLGYGEISTVLEIDAGDGSSRAYKRLPMFKTNEEAERYGVLYREYVATLSSKIGINVVPSELVIFTDEVSERICVYIVQQKLNPQCIGHRVLHLLSKGEVFKLIPAILRETLKVFEFNDENRNVFEVGFDGQLSNWALMDFDPTNPRLYDEIQLVYFDTSTPLIQKNGVEQLNPDLFLRSAPSFMVWIIRLLFLEDVMTRYYDFRNVVVDLIANFHKEQRPDLIPGLVEIGNEFLEEVGDAGMRSISEKEIASYYREDALIWKFYLAARKIDRGLHRLLRKDYPYILPVKIVR